MIRSSDWRTCTVQQIAAKERNSLVGGPFGSNLVSADYVDLGIPVIRGQNMGSGRWVTGEFAYVSDLKAQELNANSTRPGDIVFTQRGTLGQVAIVPNDPFDLYIVSQSQMKLTVDRTLADPLFMYYQFTAPAQEEYIESRKIQTALPHINLGVLKEMPVNLPPLPEQRAIAAILGSLDDKIELNRQMNRTLEAMAQALFKSWFVDFDPVRAKAEGRETGLPEDVAALFPDRLVESELGEIPEGWAVKSVLDVADLLSGGTPKTDVIDYWNGGISWVSAKDVGNAEGLFVLETEKTISRLGLENSSTKLLPALTTIITARGTVGAYCLLASPMTMNQTNYGLKAKPGIGDYFVFFLLADLVEHLRQQAYGTIFDTITTKTFRDTQIVSPPMYLFDVFHQFVEPYMNKLLGQLTQSRTLAALRDILLPKLISGEVRVKDVEKFA